MTSPEPGEPRWPPSPGGHPSFLAAGVPLDVAVVAVVVVAVVAVAMAWKARARRRAARLRISGGRRSLATNLFDRR